MGAMEVSWERYLWGHNLLALNPLAEHAGSLRLLDILVKDRNVGWSRRPTIHKVGSLCACRSDEDMHPDWATTKLRIKTNLQELEGLNSSTSDLFRKEEQLQMYKCNSSSGCGILASILSLFQAQRKASSYDMIAIQDVVSEMVQVDWLNEIVFPRERNAPPEWKPDISRIKLISRYYVMRNNVVEKILRLTRREEKYLVVAAVRFLRTCIALKVRGGKARRDLGRKSAYPGEERLVAAESFSRGFLVDAVENKKGHADKWSLKKDLSGEIEYALGHSEHKTFNRMHVRQYLDKYGPEDCWIGKTIYTLRLVNDPDYLKLAKADFNLCQKSYQQELSHVLRNCWQEPCVVFATHWSLRVGSAVHLLRHWQNNPLCLLVLTEVGQLHFLNAETAFVYRFNGLKIKLRAL